MPIPRFVILGTVAGAVATAMSVALAGNDAAPASAPAIPPPADSAAASYSTGLFIGGQLHSAGVQGSVSIEQLERGLRDGLGGKTASDDDKNLMTQFLRNGREAIAAHNRAEAQDFMAQNGKIAGVVSMASGLQYTIVKAGDAKAPSPKPTDRVSVQYRGRLLDGTVFDSSEMHPMAATFSLNGGVIKGWREALLLMKPGAEWRVFVPPDLAYGDSPPPRIPPGSLLVFDIQLAKIEPPVAMPPKQSRPDAQGKSATPGKAH